MSWTDPHVAGADGGSKMQKTKTFKLFLSVLAAAGTAFFSCTIARVQAQDASTAKPESSATAPQAQKADTEWDGVSVELSSVTRGDGDTITIKFKYTNNGSKEANISQLGQFSGDNIAEYVYYVDAKNKKKYLVVKDAEGHAVASKITYLRLEAGGSRAGWAKFPAPPASVDKITVYLPGAPPFEGVPIATP